MEYGDFSPDGKEYIITRPDTPRPWINYLWNDQYCAIFSQTGGGYSFYEPPEGDVSKRTNLTRGTLHLIRTTRNDQPGRWIYLRDDDTGDYWTINWQPVQKRLDGYECKHGLGYSIIESKYKGIIGQFRIFVPFGAPVEIWTIKVKNDTADKKRISVYTLIEWALDGFFAHTNPYGFIHATYDRKLQALVISCDSPHFPNSKPMGFMGADFNPDGYDCRRESFVGKYSSLATPVVVKEGSCNNSSACGEDTVGVLNHRVNLEPGQEKNFNIVVGTADSPEEIDRLLKLYLNPEKVEAEWKSVRAHWNKLIELITIDTPEPDLDRLVNIWLKYQLSLCGRWVRGYGYGFRDILQDAEALFLLNPEQARNNMLKALRHQYKEGNAVRAWGPLDKRDYKDSPVWIIFTLAAYLKETGDMSILEKEIDFLDEGRATVYEHSLRAVRYLYNDRGKHELCHIGDGDWSDSLDEAGTKGKGESVWLSMALFRALNLMEELANKIGDKETSQEMALKASKLKGWINKYGWDGGWYLRAYDDEGEPIGSAKCEEGKIYLNPQTWAILSGVADGERVKKCLNVIDRQLYTELGPITLTPTYTQYRNNIGRISALLPGMWENAAVYNHACTFKILADCVIGRGNKALETIKKFIPSNRANLCNKSDNEPYVFPSFYIGPANPLRAGESITSWITATAGWMFRIVTEWMLGIRPEYEGLRIDPCIPSEWEVCRITRPFRGSVYKITIENPEHVQKGVKELVVDGQKINSTLIPSFGDRKTHEVNVVMG